LVAPWADSFTNCPEVHLPSFAKLNIYDEPFENRNPKVVESSGPLLLQNN
jgi:hypothetical protein